MENKHWVIDKSLSHNFFYGELINVTDKNATVLVPRELQKYYKKNNKCNICSTYVAHNCKETVVPNYKCLLLKDEFTYDDVISWHKPYLKEYIKIYGGTEMYFLQAMAFQ